MDCFIDKERKQIIFLYKMVDGVSLKSTFIFFFTFFFFFTHFFFLGYGMNIASISGINTEVVERANFIATVMENQFKKM